VGTSIVVTEMTYQAEPGYPWSAGLSRRFIGMGETTWDTLPPIESLTPIYGTCVEHGTDDEGRQVLTFHRDRDGTITDLTYDGPPLS
jgi:hypothetical protein